MKTLYLATILVVALSIALITELPHAQASEGHVLFMKTNSIGKIFANFTFPVPDNRTWNLSPGIYLGLTGSPVQIDSNNMTIVAEPNSFVASKENVTVTYTITTKNNTEGIFALFLYFCGESPLIVGLNESEVSSDIYNQFFNAAYSCPALTDSTPTMNITGYSNMISKSINIDSNNTMKVKTLKPFNSTSPVLKNSIIVTNSSNSILPIPSSILHSPVPTLSPSEIQSVVNVALSISELQSWSHDWQYVTMGFGSNNKAVSGDFEWQYASVVLKTPSSSSPFPCNNDWRATVVIDMTTMKVVSADYPTMKSHNCDITTGGVTTIGIPTKIDLPLKQFKSGIPASDVYCKQDLELIFKAEKDSPACVKPDTAQKLIERGWAHNTLSHSAHTIISMQTMNVTNSNLSVNYTITNAKILDIKADTRSASIIISMQTSGDGNLNIVIPRTLVEYPSQTDPHLFVLGNGQEIDSREINTTSNERTLSIPFKADISQIEIIGAVCCT